MMELQKAFDDCFDAMKGYVDRSLFSLHERIDDVEASRPNDGLPGRDGRDGQPGLPGRDGANGSDGQPGKDGLDGFGFDDLSLEYDGARTLKLVFTKGDRVVEFPVRLPIPIDAGIYRAGNEYERGDVISHGGSMWIAQRSTHDKPGEGDAWRLSVKRGQNGRTLMPKEDKTPVTVRFK